MRTNPKDLAYALLFPMVLAVTVSISIFTALSAVFTVLALVSIARSGERERGLFKDLFFKIVFIYLLANLLSLTQTHFWPESLRGLFKVFRHALLCLGIVHVLDSREKILRLTPLFFIAAVIVSLDAFFQGWTGRDFLNNRKMTAYSGDQGRLTGPFKHANDFSAYLSVAATLFLGTVLDGAGFLSRKKHLLCVAGLLLVLKCLLWTYSRSGWLAFFMVAFLLGVFKKSRILLVILAGLLVWGVFFSPPLIKTRVHAAWDTDAGTIKERKILWGEAAGMIQASPILGLGVNAYSRNERSYKSAEHETDAQYAHNGYLQMAAEIGLLGLLSFFAVMFFFILKCFQAFIANGRGDPALRSLGGAFLFAVVAFLIHAAFDTNLHSLLLVNLLWICVGFAWAIRRTLVR